MIKQELTQKLQQKLSPQQIQFMKLLQIPTASLDQRIKEELESNPALEEGDYEDADLEEKDLDRDASEGMDDEVDQEDGSLMEDDVLDEFTSQYIEEDPESYQEKTLKNQEEEKRELPLAIENSLQEYLLQQVNLLNLKSEREQAIANQIIGSIDDDGYLRRDVSAIADDILFSYGIEVSEKEILEVLSVIQKLDPPGIGARDLRECLYIQLQNKLEGQNTPNPATVLALKILEKYFTEFSKKHFDKLMKAMSITDQELRDAIEEVVKLNPKPASGYSPSRNVQTQYIIPDFIIYNRDGELELTVNSQNLPDLKVSEKYRRMLKSYMMDEDNTQKWSKQDKEALQFLKQKIESAKWFIDSLQKRYNTMYRIMYTIMQAQYEYFITGDDRKIKPMILKDIADVTGLDISTVSRVANNKYVQTEFGTKIVKDFFSESIQNTEGEEVSTLEVKYLLTELVKNEDKRNPLSDEEIKELLKEKGFDMARRTIAKYREQLNIPVARLRKVL